MLLKKINVGIFFVISSVSVEFLGWGFIDPLFSSFLNLIFNNFFIVGLICGTQSFFAIFSVPVAEKLIEKVSAVFVLKIEKIFLFFETFFYFLGGFLSLKILIFIAPFFGGFRNAFRDVAVREYLMEKSNNKNASTILGTNISVRRILWSISAIFSGFFLMSAANYLHISFEKVFSVLFLPAIFLIPAATFFVFKIPRDNEEKFHHPVKIKDFLGFWEIRKLVQKFFIQKTHIQFSLLLILFLQIILAMILIFIPLYAIQINLPLEKIGILMAAIYLPILFSAIFSIFEDRIDRMSFVIFGLIFSSVLFALLAFAKAPVEIAIFSMLISFSVAIIRPANLGIIASETPHSEAKEVAALQIFFSRLGAFLGSIFLGTLAEKFGIEIALIWIATISSFFSIFAIFIKLRFREKKEIPHLEKWKIHPIYSEHFHVHEI